MKLMLILMILAASSFAFAQEGGNAGGKEAVSQTGGQIVVSGAMGAFERAPRAPVEGAPYSATITNEMIQTLADGNRIVNTSTGATARDSQGRTRQDAPLPAIGNLSAANAPHLVFIRDPVSQTFYILNLTDKTAQKMAIPPGAAGGGGPAGGGDTFFMQMRTGADMAGPLPPPPIVMRNNLAVNEQAQESTEDLGSQTMEGVLVNGLRTTRTVPAGQIGNERPISIVTEVWTSPDLKTIVYSKRLDPRIGEQTFRLTNIVRTEPDPSLFTVPADFKIISGPEPIIYRPNQ